MKATATAQHGVTWGFPDVQGGYIRPPGSEGYKKDGPAMVMVSKRWIYVRVCIGRVTVM